MQLKKPCRSRIHNSQFTIHVVTNNCLLHEHISKNANAANGHQLLPVLHEILYLRANLSFTLNAFYMLSAFQKTLSGAFSSFASVKEPKLLKRPSSDISSQPNDPARSPPEASMPHSRSSTSSKRGKAEEFLSKNFNGAGRQDDPVEVQSQNSQFLLLNARCTLWSEY